MDAHKILNDDEFKELVDKANERIEKKKENMVIEVIRELKDESQKVTFLNIKRKTGLPKSYFESEEIRKLLESVR